MVLSRRHLTVLLGHPPTAVPITTSNENAFLSQSGLGRSLALDKFREWSMALNEHVRSKRYLETIAELGNTVRFEFTTAIGEQDEGNTLFL